jgi:hypothetical protein
MRKKLTTLGNSLALVIDKPLRKMMALAPGAWVRITTNGSALVVERCEPPSSEAEPEGKPAPVREPPSLLQRRAISTLFELVNRHHMSDVRFRRLCTWDSRFIGYLGWLKCTNLAQATPVELATIDRFEACLRELRAERSWDEAIDAALVAVPLVE